MEPCQLGNGGVKDFLRDLILRGEDVLGKMIYKVTSTDVSIAEMVAMINSLFSFISKWEDNLKDISIEVLNNSPAPSPQEAKCSSTMNESKFVDQVNQLVLTEDGSVRTEQTLSNSGEDKPMFEYSEQSLKQYKPGSTGLCIISSVGPMRRSFYMVDLDHSNCRTMFAAMQNMYCDRLGQLPPAGEVFGVLIEGSVYRAVRNKPTEPNGPSRLVYLYLLDTGETVLYKPTMKLCNLSKYYREVPALAIRCMLVGKLGDLIDDGFDQYLDTIYTTIQNYCVVSVEKDVLFVRLSHSMDRKSGNSKYSQDKREENQAREGPTAIPKTKKLKKPYCPHHGSPECLQGAHPKIQRPLETRSQEVDLVVPPIGSKVMVIPKFIRDVQYLWCQLVRANDVSVEMDLKEMELLMNIPQNSLQYKELSEQPEIAQKVFAKHNGTRWYRAEVVRYFSEQKVLVFFVDHGHGDMVPMADIRQWDDRFGALPYQTILCRLSNVAPKKRFHKEAVIEMNRTLLNKRYWGRIVDNGNPLEITIYDDDGFDISVGLVIAGMATRIKEELDIDSSDSAVGA